MKMVDNTVENIQFQFKLNVYLLKYSSLQSRKIKGYIIRL